VSCATRRARRRIPRNDVITSPTRAAWNKPSALDAAFLIGKRSAEESMWRGDRSRYFSMGNAESTGRGLPHADPVASLHIMNVWVRRVLIRVVWLVLVRGLSWPPLRFKARPHNSIHTGKAIRDRTVVSDFRQPKRRQAGHARRMSRLGIVNRRGIGLRPGTTIGRPRVRL
jgi:hypothetical protein